MHKSLKYGKALWGCLVLRQGPTMHTRLTSNSHRFPGLSLLSVGITSMHSHAWLKEFTFIDKIIFR